MTKAKLTPTRAAEIDRTFRETLGVKVPRYGKGNAFYRMVEAMKEEGLLYERESGRQRDDGQPAKPELMQRGPTIKGLSAYLDQGFASTVPDVDAAMRARIVELETIEAEYETAMDAFREARQEKAAARAIRRRAERVEGFRAFFAEEGIDLLDKSDDELLELVDRIIDKEMQL